MNLLTACSAVGRKDLRLDGAAPTTVIPASNRRADAVTTIPQVEFHRLRDAAVGLSTSDESVRVISLAALSSSRALVTSRDGYCTYAMTICLTALHCLFFVSPRVLRPWRCAHCCRLHSRSYLSRRSNDPSASYNNSTSHYNKQNSGRQWLLRLGVNDFWITIESTLVNLQLLLPSHTNYTAAGRSCPRGTRAPYIKQFNPVYVRARCSAHLTLESAAKAGPCSSTPRRFGSGSRAGIRALFVVIVCGYYCCRRWVAVVRTR